MFITLTTIKIMYEFWINQLKELWNQEWKSLLIFQNVYNYLFMLFWYKE